MGSLPVKTVGADLKVGPYDPTVGPSAAGARALALPAAVTLGLCALTFIDSVAQNAVLVRTFAGAAAVLLGFLGGNGGRPVLTLAGVTGLIVSIGVTVDSYVVYFERLKDEVRAGRTVRSSVDRGFTRSFRTILAADLVSFIGAAVLFFVAVGSVKGFAFFLGLSTLLDLLVAYFFMHPLVSLMARKPSLVLTVIVPSATRSTR